MIYTCAQLAEEVDIRRFELDDLWQSYQQAIQSIDLYITAGVPLGGQLTAMVCNDLRDAFGQADEHRRRVLFPILSYLYNDIPSLCWGSQKKHDAWMALDADERMRVVAASQFGSRRALEPRDEEKTR